MHEGDKKAARAEVKAICSEIIDHRLASVRTELGEAAATLMRAVAEKCVSWRTWIGCGAGLVELMSIWCTSLTGLRTRRSAASSGP
jgi:hypothetical protein